MGVTGLEGNSEDGTWPFFKKKSVVDGLNGIEKDSIWKNLDLPTECDSQSECQVLRWP